MNRAGRRGGCAGRPCGCLQGDRTKPPGMRPPGRIWRQARNPGEGEAGTFRFQRRPSRLWRTIGSPTAAGLSEEIG